MYKATRNLLKAIIRIGHCDSWNVVVLFICLTYIFMNVLVNVGMHF